MAYYQNPVTIQILKAPARWWGVTNQIGGVWELSPKLFRTDGNYWVEFERFDIDLGGDREILYIQKPSVWVDVTESKGSVFCYPPAASGAKCIYLDGYLSISGLPVLLWCLLPPLNKSDQPNKLTIYFPDLDANFVLQGAGGKVGWYLARGNSVLTYSTETISVDTAQWGSHYFNLYIHYFLIYSKGRRWLIFLVKVGNNLETKTILANNISSYLSGSYTIHTYGALRVYQPQYTTDPFYPISLAYPTGVATPQFLWVEDRGGNLHHHEGNVFPARSNNSYPVILRRVLVFHQPTITTTGGFSEAPTAITSIDWSLDSGSIEAEEGFQFGVGDGLKIVVGDTEFLYRVKSVVKERRGLQWRYRAELENPLLQTYCVVPAEVNPYLLRWKDLVKAMKCCVHLNFNFVCNFMSDETICDLNDNFQLNSLPDWCDMLLKVAGRSEGTKWFIWGNTVYLQSIQDAVSFTMPPASQILDYKIERETTLPTIGVVGGRVIVSPEATTRGVSIRTGGYPVEFKITVRAKGLVAVPSNAYIVFSSGEHQGRIAETTSVRWRLVAPHDAETELSGEVVSP